ncbi:MAG: hypothetical protein ABIG61_04880 [Planctomycetota bacterium]
MKTAKTLKNVFLLLSLMVALLRMLQASGWNFEAMGLFGGWVVTPYIVFFCISFLMKESTKNDLSTCLASLFMLVFTLLFYIDISSSSTAGLIFIFAPFYLLIGIPIFIVISFVIARKVISKKEKSYPGSQ